VGTLLAKTGISAAVKLISTKLGALIGSIVPGAGTVIGAVVGWVVGFIAEKVLKVFGKKSRSN